MTKCRICNYEGENHVYTAREMMFGTRDEFKYFKCSNCGCLQIKDFPADISKYYPDNYNSLTNYKPPKLNKLRLFLRHQKAKYCLNIKKTLIGWTVIKFSRCGFLAKINNLGLDFSSSILDVGTGMGKRLMSLSNYGFKDLTGTDIFIKSDVSYSNGINIYKKDISKLSRKYDFIMLNHVFEHMPNPLQTLRDIHKILNNKQYLMIRIPIVDSYAWDKYGTNWVQLDPPRHYFLHSQKSMDIIAQKAGFKIIDIKFDSQASQFYGSEQYVRNIPMKSENSYYINPNKSIFKKSDIRMYEKLAIKVNKEKRGDAACFYLIKGKNE